MFESCTRNFSSLRNPHSRVPKFVFGSWGGFFLNKNSASDLCTHTLLRVEMVTNYNLYCTHSSFKKSAYSCSKNALLDYKY